MQYSSTPAVSTFVTLDELRALTLAAQRQGKGLTQIVEEAVDHWVAYTDQHGPFDPPPLPNPPRMGVQAVLGAATAAALDRIRAGRYSRAVAVYAALSLWLAQSRAGDSSPAA